MSETIKKEVEVEVIVVERIFRNNWSAKFHVVADHKIEVTMHSKFSAEDAYLNAIKFLGCDHSYYYKDKSIDKITYLIKPTSEYWQTVLKYEGDNKPREIEHHGDFFVNHFIECLPPLMHGSDYVLCSEPYTHNNEGKGVYIGIYKKHEKYYAVYSTRADFINHLK